MKRNLLSRIFPTRPLLGMGLTLGAVTVCATMAYALTAGHGVEGTWSLDTVNHNTNICNEKRSSDYCQGDFGGTTFCDPQTGGHHNRGTAFFDPATGTCDTGPNNAYIQIDMTSANTNHIATVSNTPPGP